MIYSVVKIQVNGLTFSWWSSILKIESKKTQKSVRIKKNRKRDKMKYSNEFKKEALKLSDEIGVKKAALQLGLPYYTLADWRNRTRNIIEGTSTEPGKTLTQQDIRILELERENEELRRANDILKDALGFFAKDRKK